MSCNVVNSQSQVQSRLPSLPQTLPKTQADWNAVLSAFGQWGQILQQANHAPNVIPSQFQTFTSGAASAVIAALSAANCTPSVDATQQYYGGASLKVAISATGATLAFSGYPISIAKASRWFASFQIYAPSGCTGSLTVKTAAHSVTESFTVSALAEWQQVWGLVDFRQYADTQATWQLTFTSTATVWLDGMQMNSVGSPIGMLPKFAGTQMVAGPLTYASSVSLDTQVTDGPIYQRTQRYNLQNNTASAAWIHVGTLILTAGSSASFRWHSGQGYNTGANQQTVSEIVVRAANDTAAPNISGISAITHGKYQPVASIKLSATGGSVSVTNHSWEVYAQLSAFATGPIEAVINASAGDSFAFSGATGSDPGSASSSVVVGFVGQYIDPTRGNGMDGFFDGLNFLRMPCPPSVSGGSSTSLTQSGTTTTINVGAGTYYLGNLTVNASAGSVDPGAYGTYYIYFDNPGYTGGAVTYQWTTNILDLSKGPFRFGVGQITTTSGGTGTGGGSLPPCFSGGTRIMTTQGLIRFDELPPRFEIDNRTGRHSAALLIHPNSIAPLRRMGEHFVTEDHLIAVGDGWVKAKFLFHEKVPVEPRTVYNLHVFSDDPNDHHYILENGLTAHNWKP